MAEPDKKQLQRYIRRIGHDIGATEAALFRRLPDGMGDREVEMLFHIRPGDCTQEQLDNAVDAFKKMIGRCIALERDGAIRVGEKTAGISQYCIVKHATWRKSNRGVLTFIIARADQESAVNALDRVSHWINGRL